VKSGDPDTASLPSDPADLLLLALSRPHEALSAARALLAGEPSPYDASLAHQTIGIVLRDRGDLPEAIRELRKAARLAQASGRPERKADVQATLGVALAWAGRSRQGLAVLDQAVAIARGHLAGQVLVRRATALWDVGRFHEAHQDLNRALPHFRRAGDTVWEVRSLSCRAYVFLGLGLPRRAAVDLARAEELSAANGQDLEYAYARHNLGLAALTRGDLPEALSYLDEAARRYQTLGEEVPELAVDRCLILLAAGLTGEAAEETDTALNRIPPGRGNAYRNADLFYAAATADLAIGDAAGARQRAAQARRMFKSQSRPLWEAQANLVLTEARYAAGEHSAALFRYAAEVATRLEASRSGEAMRAHLLAGRIALSRGSVADADPHLERAARYRRRGPPLPRSRGWLARALQADAQGNARATVIACGRGLDALEEHQLRLGATELRAYGTAHGAELATLAQRNALRRGDTRRLLYWSERWRATALAARSGPPGADKDLAAELEALRSVSRLLRNTEMAASRRNALERERRRLEAAVQARTRRLPGDQKPGARVFDLDELFAELGPTTLIELITVDSVLYALVVAGGRLRLHTIGIVPEREVQMDRFVLRRLARGRPHPGDELLLKYRGAQLEASLLGSAAARLGDGPVVVIPPGRLRAVPWTLMPAFRDRVVTVAPSASTWLRARRMQPPSPQRVALVAGPGLTTQGAEVETLRARYPGAELLSRGQATASRVLAALDGAWLAHIAAHGSFRADNPMFSSILLDDGPLIVHDFERLGRAPYQLVLANCDSGVAAPVGADELLGLVSSLVPLGAAGIVASIVPVNDRAVVPLMLALHDALHRGATLPEAMLAARLQAGDDPQAEATAHSFMALGA
jgi:CHAT domain-containing protein